MVKKLVGKQNVDYFSRKKNKQTTGISLHVMGEDSRVEGLAVETIWVAKESENMYADALNLPVGADIEVFYNRAGYADSFKLCK